jgi:hypothetical protein
MKMERLLQPFDHVLDLFLALAKLLLQATEEFVILTFGEYQIVIRQVTVALFQFAFDFIPRTFEL